MRKHTSSLQRGNGNDRTVHHLFKQLCNTRTFLFCAIVFGCSIQSSLLYVLPGQQPNSCHFNCSTVAVSSALHDVSVAVASFSTPCNTNRKNRYIHDDFEGKQRTNNVSNRRRNFSVVQSIYDVSTHHHEDLRQHTNYNISAAVCHSLIADVSAIDVGLVLQWIVYHHLLGFDHFFLFHFAEVTKAPNWGILLSNRMVTTIEWNGNGSPEIECLSKYAVMFDWVFFADHNEYLFLGNKNRDDLLGTHIDEKNNGYIRTHFSSSVNRDDILTVKEFLHLYDRMDYLSFGKRMYSLDHRVDNDGVENATQYRINTFYGPNTKNVDAETNTTSGTLRNDTDFIVSKYSYYMDQYYCYHRARRGDSICPKWRGRAKVMVRPQFYPTSIDVHGMYAQDQLKPQLPFYGSIHFHPDLYHVKEWPHIHDAHDVSIHHPPPPNTKLMENDVDNFNNFTIMSEDEVHIYSVPSSYRPYKVFGNKKNRKEIFLVKQDANLQQYFQNVVNIATDPSGNPICIQHYIDHHRDSAIANLTS